LVEASFTSSSQETDWTYSLAPGVHMGSKCKCHKQATWLLITKVWSESCRLVTERLHYNARPKYASCSYIAQVLFFIVECGITCCLRMRVLCIYSTFGYHPHPLGYLANFVSVTTSIVELAHGEKSHTQSLTHPAYLMCREPKLLLRNNRSFIIHGQFDKGCKQH